MFSFCRVLVLELVSLPILGGCITVSPDLESQRPATVPPASRYDSVAVTGLAFQGDLQGTLTEALLNHRVTREVVSEAPVRIEGKMLSSAHDSSGGQIAWNVVNSVCLFFIFGGPYVGSTQANFEIRVYENGQHVGTTRGGGRASWAAVYAIGHNIPEGRKQALERAEDLSIWNAVESLARSRRKG